MPKKTKLNSKNPKYLKVDESAQVEYTREFVKEVKGCKVYNLYIKK